MDILGFGKLIYHYDKLEKLKRNTLQFPVHATVSLGNFCNHRCLWCTVYAAQQKDVQHMDGDRLIAFLTRARERGLKAVGYVGNGEPTTHPKFREIIHAVHELSLEQGMFTNGYLLDRVFDEALEFFTYIRISLDAGTGAVHDAMHDVDGHFEKIMANLSILVSRRDGEGPTLGIQYAVHHRNLDDMHEAARRARDVGVDYFSIKPVFNRGAVGERIEKNRLTLDDLSPEVARIRRDFESSAFAVHFRPFQVLSEAADHNVLTYDRCVAGFFNVNVYEDGRIVGCGPHQVSVGVMEDDLDDIERAIRDASHALDLSKCPGGCRYHALNHLGDTVLNPERARQYHANFL